MGKMQESLLKRIVNKAIYIAAIGGPLSTLPQSYAIWCTGDTSGVSLVTWILFTCSSSIWLVYGLVHKDKPVIVSGILWVVLYLIVIVGILVHL
ncbi:hypothetical protein COB28_00515 [Candidatus Dependentiae bacterium]|nr:MAG: hypothetical protein COB28_00515 [Candidatus Dependentiae bacterium]